MHLEWDSSPLIPDIRSLDWSGDSRLAGMQATPNIIRLVGGSTAFEGRVEIFHNGEWGTICSNGADANDAMVCASGTLI